MEKHFNKIFKDVGFWFLSVLIFSVLVFSFSTNVVFASVANISSSPENLLSGLASWWTFDGKNVNSTTVTDSSGNGKDGTFVNFGSISAAQSAGKFGQALRFPGAGYFSYSIALTNTHSYSFWINPTDSGDTDYGTIFANSTEANGLFFLKSQRKINLFYSFTDHLNNTALPLNKWTHVVVVSSAGSATFYINGVADGTASSNPSITISRTGNAPLNSEQFVGQLDDVKVYNRALSASEVVQLYNLGQRKINASSAVVSSGLIGWWTFDGKNLINNVKDSSVSGVNGTLQGFGATSTEITAGKIGQALRFNGSDWVSLGNDTSYNLQSFSISAWVNSSSLATNRGIFGNQDANNHYGYLLRINTSGSLTFRIDNPSGTPLNTLNSTGFTASLNKWYHVTVTSDGTTITLYINGVYNNQTSPQQTIPYAATQYPMIGRRTIWATAPDYFAGSLDDVRFYNRALSASEVGQIYNSSQPKVNISASGISNGLIGWWTFDGKNLINNVVDSSGNGNTGYFNMGTQSNIATSSSVRAGKFGQALNFDGRDDRVDTGSDFIGTSALTVTAWVLPTDLNAGAPRVIDNTKTRLWLTSSSRIAFSSDGASSAVSSSVVPVSINGKWQFVAVTRTAAGVTNLYANGVLSGTADQNSGTPTAGSSVAIGGISGSPTSNPFKGNIDDVRVYNRVLSASEIYQLYQMGR